MGLLRKIPRKAWNFLNIINKLVKKDEKRIFIYSNLGFYDNVKALYDHLIENGYNKKYKIIVSLNNWNDYAEGAEENVKFISNVKGLFSFFRCKFCFYCFGKYPVKPSKKQIVFNMWHGMPLKKIGNMVKGCEKVDYNYFTHLLCTSEYFRDIMKKSFNATDEQIFICGQPRTDEMLTHIPEDEEISAKAAVAGYKNRFSKMILWLPTFRENADTELDILSVEQLSELDDLCGENDWCMVVKLHPLSKIEPDMYEGFENISFINNKILEELHINFYSLIGMSSCLITDYSSVYFDYMLLDKPIAFAVSDIEKYENDRGFIFDDPLSVMPGDIIENGDDFLKFAKKMFDGKDDYVNLRRKLSAEFNKYCDNKNCERVLSVLNSKTEDKSRKLRRKK